MSGPKTPRQQRVDLVSGHGKYVADIQPADALHAVVVRSPVAHGYLRGVDTSAAEVMSGVRAIITAGNFAGRGPSDVAPTMSSDLAPAMPVIPMRLSARDGLTPYLQPVMACDRVRYVGEPIAVVVAEDPYLAEDAAEAVTVDIAELPAVVHLRGEEEDGPALFDGTSSNVLCELEGSYGDIDEAFAIADGPSFGNAGIVVTERFRIGRHSGVPMETRGLIARWDGARLELWGVTKVAHVHRRILAELMGLPEEQIRVHAVDVGGGFGVRGEFYPEDFLIPWLARSLGRPIKWIEDRREHLMAMNHSREQWHEASIAVSRNGRLLGLRDRFWNDMGAYVRTVGARVPELTIASLFGPYKWQAFSARCTCLMSNKTPTGTMRSPGRLEATFVRERLIDLAARELNMDPIELRSRNLIEPEDMPFSPTIQGSVLGISYDSGHYRAALNETLVLASYQESREQAAEERRQGRRVGVGVAIFTEKTGVGPHESANVIVHDDGRFLLTSGSAVLGQGVDTTLATIASRTLGVPNESIEVDCGDTDTSPFSIGSFASRSTIFAGNAVHNGCQRLIEAGREMAESLFEFGPVSYRHGVFSAGPHHNVTWADLLQRAGQTEIRVEGEFEAIKPATALGVHMAEVEVDADTGGIEVRRLAVGYDIGCAISRDRVAGQLAGGTTHGLGGALFEEFRYDAAGQPQNVSFMDYLLPTCAETPAIETHVLEMTPAPGNPLGVKGAGEGGVPGVAAAIAGAVDNALEGCGSFICEIPMTPDVVRSQIRPGESRL
ncbi:MAG: xanthine dehydrogenase family protein molybdopterin-binding subunit [Chloroflexota bacterium]|nr:xanthine dehydrogenase family protein molybdopterin-binding subunit [Chloroflexota bacterium]